MNIATGTVQAGEHTYSNAYRIYILLLLTLVYVSNFADRMILAVLTEPIKAEFGVSDTAMGVLGGFAFAAIYTTFGIPIAMLADRKSRTMILSAALGIWSAFTVVCGFATNYWYLMFARFGVALGEAGGGPPSQAMISDLFPAEKRATALAVFSTGVPIGYVVGLGAGGWIAQEYGWQYAFIALGAPGLLLALLVYFTIREPMRGQSDPPEVRAARAAAAANAPGPAEVVRFMLSQPSLVHVMAGATIVTLVGYAGVQWNVPYLMRAHGMSLAQASGVIALITATASVAGTFLGGWLADTLGKRDRRWNSWIVALFFAIGTPIACFVYTSSQTALVLWAMAVPVFVSGLYIAPSFAMTQNLVGVRMRAMAAALLLFIMNFIGMGLGPFLAGLLSDIFLAPGVVDTARAAASAFSQNANLAAVFASCQGAGAAEGCSAFIPAYQAMVKAQGHALGYALFLLTFLNIWGILHYILAARTLVRDYERAEKV